jgi:hypothetical protein
MSDVEFLDARDKVCKECGNPITLLPLGQYIGVDKRKNYSLTTAAEIIPSFS